MKWLTFEEFSKTIKEFGEATGTLDLDDFERKIGIAYRNYILADSEERERTAQFDLLSRARVREMPIKVPCPNCEKPVKLTKLPENPNGYESAFLCKACDSIFYSQWTVDQWVDAAIEEVRERANRL